MTFNLFLIYFAVGLLLAVAAMHVAALWFPKEPESMDTVGLPATWPWRVRRVIHTFMGTYRMGGMDTGRVWHVGQAINCCALALLVAQVFPMPVPFALIGVSSVINIALYGRWWMARKRRVVKAG